MSASPPPPDRRPLPQRSGSQPQPHDRIQHRRNSHDVDSEDRSSTPVQAPGPGRNDKLQIRVVPYSPPRISSDGSAPASSRPASYADSSPAQDNVEIHYRDTPEPGFPHSPAHVSSLRRHLSHSATPGPETDPTNDPGLHRNEPRHASAPSSAIPSSPSPSLSPSLSPSPSPALAPSRTPSPLRRQRKVVTVHANKTFSLVPTAGSSSSRTDSARSPQPSLTTSGSSYGRLSSGTFADERPSSPLTPLPERSPPPGSPATSPKPLPDIDDPSPAAAAAPSPWNYRLRGGLRKVPNTPDSKQKQPASSSAESVEPLPPLPEVHSASPPAAAPQPPPLAYKPSLQSSNSDSTLSERSNYKVYGQSSPVAPGSGSGAGAAASVASDPLGIDLESQPPSSSHSNYQILAESSSSNQSLYDLPRPQTAESEANFVVHGGPSASASSLITTQSRVRSEYSRESLIVPPLRPVKRRSAEHLGISKARSKESLRTGSLKSISTFINQEATRSLFAGPATVHFPPGSQRQTPWGGSSSAGPSNPPQMIPTHPHQWSSQLSTVASESEPGSEPPSRSLSPLTVSGRRSSGFNSFHSRQMLSISSSLGGLEEAPPSGGPSQSRSGSSLDRPQPVLSRGSPRDPGFGNIRQVRHHDEDGDGLADLEQLHHRPSRTRLGSVLSSHSADRNLRSSSSSRSNSLTYASLPAWARVYYGSGERRFLIAQASSESMISLYNDSRPGSGVLNRAPSLERFAGNIFNPRRRPREAAAPQPTQGQSSRDRQGQSTRDRQGQSSRDRRRQSRTGSMDITPYPVLRVARGVKKQTSSIWSPHLQHDRRASRYSIWEPPSAVWSAESGLTGRRNLQVVLFVVGFIFPFAWMVAAFLPLPPQQQQLDMVERLQSTSHIDLRLEASRQAEGAQETRYWSAKWWRNLNRGMAVIGLLVIGAAVALAVVGVRQKWAS